MSVNILEELESIIAEKIRETKIECIVTDEEPLRALQELIFYIKYDLRTYAISTDTQLEKLWEFIRANERHLDFILETKISLVFKVGREEWDNEIDNYVCTCYGILDSVMDVDTIERLPTGAWLKEALEKNDWFFVILLLKLIKIPDELLIEPRGKHGKERNS